MCRARSMLAQSFRRGRTRRDGDQFEHGQRCRHIRYEATPVEASAFADRRGTGNGAKPKWSRSVVPV